jgi:hypothetical protein
VTSRHSSALLAAALLVHFVKSAAATPTADAERVPQTPRWRLDLPPAPPDPGPPPDREEDEHPRRAWEISPRLGFALPLCHGYAAGQGRCDSTGTGTGMGAGALWRIAPYVALGLEGGLSRFGIDAGVAAGSARSSWVGAVVRGYFLERGFLDPYAQTGFGRGSFDTAYNEGGVEVRLGGSGPATMVGAGLDFWISSHVKAGPAIAYYWAFIGDMRSCSGPVCSVTSVRSAGAVASSASISLTVAVTLGREM